MSVTRDDHEKAVEGGGVSVWLGPVGLLSGLRGLAKFSAGLSHVGTRERDRLLSLTTQIEGMWASAVFKALSKQAALGFRIEDSDDSKRRVKAAQDLILSFDGQYVKGVQRGLQDYLTTDNGQFVEVVWSRSSGGALVKPVGLYHLDSLRCYRTGDPEKPVMYNDYRGGWHLLRDQEVLMLTDMPSARVEMRGYGLCAASRAWNAILKLAAVEMYFQEKVTGTRNLAIHIVNGITDKQLREALSSSQVAANEKGYVLYKGSTILTSMKEEAPTVVTIPLAEIPDGFEVVEERKYARTVYAHSIGINVDELVERAAGLNSGMSAQIADEAAEGQGLASWRKQWELALTHRVLPNTTTFYLATNDYRDQELKAKAAKARADMLSVYVDKGAITPAQMLNIAVDNGDLDKSLLPQDDTTAGVIEDNEKVSRGTPGDVVPPATQPVLKAVKFTDEELDSLIDAELADAVEWARRSR